MQTEEELKLLSNQARFISGIISGEIKFVGRERKELLQEIIDKGFDPIRGQGHTPVHQAVAGGEESPAEEDPSSCYYEYLIYIPLRSVNGEHVQHLLTRISEIEEAMRSSHTGHGEARSDRVAAGHHDVSEDSEAAAPRRRRRKRSAADSVPMDDDDDDEEEEAAEMCDCLRLAAIVRPEEHGGNTPTHLHRLLKSLS
ncbi:hypothetical protein ZWY2020_012011 [Hordeum vulgare]|nr:hypothetical protein ZWY2020_012011 [Hordeum vulgare]